MKTVWFAAVSAIFISGCSIIPVPHRVSFDESELASYLGSGSGTVTGVITAKSDGEIHVGDQSNLTLLPVCTYTREIIDREVGNGELLGSSDPRPRKYLRFAKAGPQGQFVFTGVPPGDYFCVGLVQWYFASDLQYNWSCCRVRVAPGGVTKVQVSEDWHHPGKPYLVVWRID